VLRRVGSGRESLLVPTLLTVVFAVAARFDIVPWLRGPAPYPPEWQWGFAPDPLSGAWLPALLAGGAVLALFALSGSRRAHARPRLFAHALLGAGSLAGWAFSLALLATSPEGPFRTLLARAASRTITSYHAVAVSDEARDPRAFLSRHAALLADLRGSAKHAATHPPGPVLFYRAALALGERSAPLTDALLGAARVPEREFPPPNTRPARAAALLGALVLGVLGAATAWPVASLAETLGLRPLAAARAGVLYLVLPGPALMVPQFDGALALPVAGATALLASAAASGRAAVPKALLAGALGALAVFTSYGAVVFLGIGALAAGAFASTAAGGVRRILTAASLATATLLTLFGATALLGHDPIASARAALAIHREAYTAPRSYALWLLFNPLDLAVFLGLPIAVLVAARLGGAAAAWRDGLTGGGRFLLALGGGIAALVLSGVTRGEVGRIWIPLMPLLLVGALAPGETAEATALDRRGFAACLAALLVILCLAIRTSWEL
jgi:hypothetical protein